MRTITQTQIRAYERCRRLYYLQYIRELVWPVSRTVPSEIKRGNDFHLLARQLLLGFPRETLVLPDDNGMMERWLDNFQREQPARGCGRIVTEKEVSALYAGVLWLGKYDALAVDGDHLTIFDWKTGTHRADAASYLKSPQTRLYRFLAKYIGPRLIGKEDIPAENIRMIYWFAEHSDWQICLPYSEQAYQEDLTWLDMKAHEMSSEEEKDYPPSGNKNRCGKCGYCTYCFPEMAENTGAGLNERAAAADPEYVFQEEFPFFGMSPDDDQADINF